MKQIDKNKPVMVTGATGYVAGWVVKKLLDEGLTVHASVRDPENPKKLKYLDELTKKAPGEIKYFTADLLDEGSYKKAMAECEVVFHTASPFKIDVTDPQKELVDPAQLGTRNVLEEANRTPSVKRVVLTSSCAAIYGDNADLQKTPTGIFTENIWNTSSFCGSVTSILKGEAVWKTTSHSAMAFLYEPSSSRSALKYLISPGAFLASLSRYFSFSGFSGSRTDAWTVSPSSSNFFTSQPAT